MTIAILSDTHNHQKNTQTALALPLVAIIARVLKNREGRPWIMRRRTQAEMDALVRNAGFTRRELLIDEDGIFTVGIAERNR